LFEIRNGNMSSNNSGDKTTNISELKEEVDKYIEERDWKKYHTPKDLSFSLVIELAELMERFQWEDQESIREMLEDGEEREKIKDEVADVAIYLLSFCNTTDIDLSSTVLNKIEKIKEKYPKDKVLDNDVYKKDYL